MQLLAPTRNAWRSLYPLGWRDRWQCFVVLALAAVVEIGLRTVRLERLAKILHVPVSWEATTEERHGMPSLPAWAARRQTAVRRVMNRWPWDTCLRRSLISGQRLRTLEPRLRVGVARSDGEVTAHAWIEIAGASLDPGVATFEPLLRPRS